MRRSIVIGMVAVLLVVLVASCAEAWVRAKMYDAVTPYDPKISNGEFPGFKRSKGSGYEILPGQLIGPEGDKRWAVKIACPFGDGTDSHVYYDTSSSGWSVDGTAVSSMIWSIYVEGDVDDCSDRDPSLVMRFPDLTLTNPGYEGGTVFLSYDANIVDGTDIRGWYLEKGTITSGGVPLDSTNPLAKKGLPMEAGQWHRLRMTIDPEAGTFDIYLNDGFESNGTPGGDTLHMSGLIDATSTGSAKFYWGKRHEDDVAKTWYTEYIYWGQGDEVSAPQFAESYDMGGVNVNVVGDTATVTWNTDDTTDLNKVVWDQNFYTWSQTATDNTSGTVHSVNLTGLQPSASYTFYCESEDSVSGKKAAYKALQFQTPTQPLPMALGNAGFEEGAGIYPWVECVLPESGDATRWGGSYHVLNETFGALTGEMFSGSTAGGYQGRDWATIAQQVSVDQFQTYLAKVWFSGSQNYGMHEDAMGRIGIDPTGTDPATLDGSLESLEALPIVWGAFAEGGPWQEATALALAQSDVITVFVQQHYFAPAGTQVWCQFDDASIEVGPALPTTCADAKSWTIGYPVNLMGANVTFKYVDAAAVAPDPQVIGYVQDAVDRPAGIRVVADLETWPAESLGVGTAVDIIGVLEINSDGELQVAANSISAAAGPSETVHSLGLPNRSIGGGDLQHQIGTYEGQGTNTIGLLVRTWGKVTGIEAEPPGLPSQPFSIFVDDGTGLTAGVDGSTTIYPGVEVKCFGDPVLGGMSFTVGDYVLVTGVSSLKLWDSDNDPETNNSLVQPVILIRDADDVQFSGVD